MSRSPWTFALPIAALLSATCGDSIDRDQSAACRPVDGMPSPFSGTAPRTLYDRAQFLFKVEKNGDVVTGPLQAGVDPAFLEPERAAILSGMVRDADGKPLPCVKVMDTSGRFGWTLSRTNGSYDLAVNGAADVRLSFALEGYLPAWRDASVARRDFVLVQDVVLLPQPPVLATVPFPAPADVPPVRGKVESSDGRGPRQLTLLFAAGTSACVRRQGGCTAPKDGQLAIHAVEYTTGDRGPAAMPAPMPSFIGYTFAAQIGAAEEFDDGVLGIEFDRPVATYIENFLHFPVGIVVPAGGYDPPAGKWTAEDNGRIVRIKNIENDRAVLEIGAGQVIGPGDLPGLDDAELHRLAALYRPGTELWRMPLSHFSPPKDWNFLWGPPRDAIAPPDRQPLTGNSNGVCVDDQNASKMTGKVALGAATVDCAALTVHYDIDVKGAKGLRLHYASDRAPAYQQGLFPRVPLTTDSIPPSLTDVRLRLYGPFNVLLFDQSFDRASLSPGLVFGDLWKAVGRMGDVAKVRVDYEYPGSYYGSIQDARTQFGRFDDFIDYTRIGPVILSVSIWKEWGPYNIALRDAAGERGIGGFAFSVHHSYDADQDRVLRGDGTWFTPQPFLPYVVDHVAGTGAAGRATDGQSGQVPLSSPAGLAISTLSDPMYGKIFLLEEGNCWVRRLANSEHDGQSVLFAYPGMMTWSQCPPPQGRAVRTEARLGTPAALGFGLDKNLYIAGAPGWLQVVNLSTPPPWRHENVYPVAGNGTGSDSGMPGDPSQIGFARPVALAFGESLDSMDMQTIYILDQDAGQVRRVDVPLQQPAMETKQWTASLPVQHVVLKGLAHPGGMALQTAAGVHTLYISDTDNHRVLSVVIKKGSVADPKVFAGTGSPGYDDPPPANARFARLSGPTGLALLTDPITGAGALLIADTGNHVIRQVELDSRAILTIAGMPGQSGKGCDRDTARPAGEVSFGAPTHVAVSGDQILVDDRQNHRVCRIRKSPIEQDLGKDVYLIPDPDNHGYYVFSRVTGMVKGQRVVPGQHLLTLDEAVKNDLVNYQGHVQYTFNYAMFEGKSWLSELVDHTSGSDESTMLARSRDGMMGPVSLVIYAGNKKVQHTLLLNQDGFATSIKRTDPPQTWTFTYEKKGQFSGISDDSDRTLHFDDGGRLDRYSDKDHSFTLREQ